MSARCRWGEWPHGLLPDSRSAAHIFCEHKEFPAALEFHSFGELSEPLAALFAEWSTYVYVRNDPVGVWDPRGLYTCTGGKADCAAIDQFVKSARTSLKGLDRASDAYKNIARVLSYLGAPGAKNGVVFNVALIRPLR